jgi:hypothetical protein
VAVGDADEEVVEVVPAFTVVGTKGVLDGATKLADVPVEVLVNVVDDKEEKGGEEDMTVLTLDVDGAVADPDGPDKDVEAPPVISREAPALEPEAALTPVEWTVSSQLPPHVSLVSPAHVELQLAGSVTFASSVLSQKH